MDIVSRLPFQLKFLTHYYDTIVKECTQFTELETEAEALNTVEIEENDPISILFYAKDADAKLYLEALDIIPNGYGVLRDEQGLIYRKASDQPFPLYKLDGTFDALRVDRFSMIVECEGKRYYGILNVCPKQLDNTEWEVMKDDLEKELRGLAMDVVRTNIGLGKKESADIPPQYLYKFLVMKKHSQKILQALIDIQKKPKYEVEKEYQRKSALRSNIIDNVTIKHHLTKCNNQEYYVPHKVINYDIHENRVLKKMLKYYEKELDKFLAVVNNSKINYANIADNQQYKEMYLNTLMNYSNAAQKLKYITNIIKQEIWFKTVGDAKGGHISHSFAMDSRYGAVYRMYRELKKEEVKVSMDPRYSYSWKKSSTLYEMWCYITLCKMLQERYEKGENILSEGLKDGMIIPFLKKGTKTTFINENVKLDVLYNTTLGRSKSMSKRNEGPYYMSNKHVVPDIIINMYYKPLNMYIGSMVLECKYRKLNSFWNGTTMSSKNQIMAYYTGAKSDFYYNISNHDVRPVRKVFVLTPDRVKQDNSDAEIALRCFRPNDTETQIGVLEEIEKIILERVEVAVQESL